MIINRIAIFASGRGSNAGKIIEFIKDFDDIEVGLIVSNKKKAGVLKLADQYQIKSLILDREVFFKKESLIDFLLENKISHIVLAGFLWKIPEYLIQAFPNKIVNIHPALLPKYGGKGMYGQYVHEAVFNNKEEESGITIHLVNENYDEGKILFQSSCLIAPSDGPREIAKKVLELEHRHYPEVICQWISQ